MAEFNLDHEIIEIDADLRVLSDPVRHQEILRQFAKEVWAQAVKRTLKSEHAWLIEAHRNASVEIYGGQYLRGFKSAANWVDFHAATPEAFPHLKEPGNG